MLDRVNLREMAEEEDAEKAEEMGRELAEVATFGALRDAGLVNARRGVGLLVEYARSERAAWAEVQELERARMRRVAGEAVKGLGGVDELKVAETKAKGSRLAGLGETIVTGFQSLGQMFYALEGVAQLLESMAMVKKAMNPNLKLLGVLATMYDRRTSLSMEVMEEVRKYFKDKVFATMIPRNVRVAEAPSHGVPVGDYDKFSKGAKAYKALAREVVERTEE